MSTATREYYEKRAKVFYNRYYAQLEGATILKYLGFKEGDEWGQGFPSFLVKYQDGSIQQIQISKDEEGNDGGFIFLPFEPSMMDWDEKNRRP